MSGTYNILVRQASKGNFSSRIRRVGIFALEVSSCPLGTRIREFHRSGCPTPYLISEPKSVEIVHLGYNRYVVQDPGTGDYYGEVIVRHDEQLTCPTCDRPVIGED